MAPTAARLTDAAAHHQHVDDAAIAHIHVVPVIETSTENDHGASLGLLCIMSKFARNSDDLILWNASDLFSPGRRVRQAFIKSFRRVLVAKTTIKTIIGREEIENGGDHRVTVCKLYLSGWHLAHQNAVMIGTFKEIVFSIAEIRKRHIGNRIVITLVDKALCQLNIVALAVFFFQIPLAVFTPAIADRTTGRDVTCKMQSSCRRPPSSSPDCCFRQVYRQSRKRG